MSLQDPSLWSSKLAPGVLAYNTMENCVTGVTPFFAVYGCQARLPIDLIMQLPADDEKPDDLGDNLRIVVNLRDKFRINMKYMLENQDSYLNHESSQPDRTLDRQKVAIGDIVYYFSQPAQVGTPTTLQRCWIGPYHVVRIVSQSVVIIKPIDQQLDDRYELPAVVNRLSKVDPQKQPTKMYTRLTSQQETALLDCMCPP